MLYWIWFFALTALGWYFAYRVWHEKGVYPAQYQIASHMAMMMALAMSWDVAGINIYSWIQNTLPQQGTEIHSITVLLISGVIALIWIVHPIFSAFLFMDSDGNVSLKNFKYKGYIPHG